MISDSIPDLKRLTPREKLILATELWENFRDSDQDDGVNEAVYRVLEERFSAYRDDPSTAVTWDEFRKRLGKE
ncbi:MAG TPA: addiction module protein [Verrucomicrobiales bacterium]|nr:addiction module protein [Verrucomicrobiales bacterium]